MTESLAEYKRNVRIVQGAIFTIPISVHLLRPHAHFMFPPLGDADGFVMPLILCVVGLFSIIPWVIKPHGRAAVNISVVGALIFCLWYAYSVEAYVVGVPIPALNRTIYVSVGSERSENANRFFPGKNNREMLIQRGPREEEVRWLFTDNSINRARFELTVSYLGLLSFMNFGIGQIARQHEAPGQQQ